jgi:hypothetical protein
MIYISPYEKRKSVLGDLIEARSPSFVFLEKVSSGYIPSSSVSFLSYLDLKIFDKQDEKFNLFFLDPEVVDNLGKEYIGLIRKISRNGNLDSVSIVSRSMSVGGVVDFLKKTNLSKFVKERKIVIDVGRLPGIFALMTEDKFHELVNLLSLPIEKGSKKIIVVTTKSSLEYLERRLVKIGIKAKAYFPSYDERIKRKVLMNFRLGRYEVLFVSRSFFKSYKGILNPGGIVYFSPPVTFSSFFRDLSNFSSEDGFSGRVFVLFSDRDERVVSKIVRKHKDKRKECLGFINFLFSRDKIRSIKNYFLDGYISAKLLGGFDVDFSVDDYFYSNTFGIADTKNVEFNEVNYLRGGYWEMGDIINLLLGVDEGMSFYKGFGSVRGRRSDEIKEFVYSALNKGFLNVEFFIRNGILVKKFF